MTRSRRKFTSRRTHERFRRIFVEKLEDRSLLAPVVVWDEGVNGDLPGVGALQNVPLGSGLNEVRGNTGVLALGSADSDHFVIEVPAGGQLTNISFSASGTAGTLASVGWGIRNGATTSSPVLVSNQVVSIPAASAALFPAILPLGPGQYRIYDAQFTSAINVYPSLADYIFTFDVTNSVSQPPVITSNGSGDTASVSVNENATAVADVDATDVDEGQTLTYSIVGGSDAGKFAINAASGVLRFVAAPDYENPTDSDKDNVYQVVVSVSDGFETDSQTLSVTVNNIPGNEPPVFLTGGGGTTATINVAENSTAVVDIDAIDPEGSTVTYSKVGGVDAFWFSLNTSTGALAFFLPPDFENPTDLGRDNSYVVNVRASAGGQSTTQTITVKVGNLNEAPIFTSNFGADSVRLGFFENTQFQTVVDGMDPDAGTTLSFRISGGADAERFSLDVAAKTLSFVAPPDFEHPTDADQDNFYEVIVEVSDGLLTDTQEISVRVFDALENRPVAADDSGETDEESVLAVVSPGLLENDIDADVADTKTVISVNDVADNVGKTIELPSGALVTVQADGSYQYDPNGKFESLAVGKTGTDSFVYTMNDVQGTTSSATVTIHIKGVNDDPSAGDKEFETNEGTLLTVGTDGLPTNDVDGDTLTFAAQSLPRHGELDLRLDGSFSYLPEKNFSGEDSFTYQVSDGRATSNVATVSLNIISVNSPPRVAEIGDVAVNEGTAFFASGSFVDSDTDDSWSATVDYGDGGGQQPLMLRADNTFSLGHTYADNGNFLVVVTVQDSGNLGDEASFHVLVRNVQPQNVTWNGPLFAARGQSLAFAGSFTDPGTGDTHTASVDWGDGSVTAAAITGGAGVWQTSAKHSYALGGMYQVRLNVTDDDGGIGTVVTSVFVAGVRLNQGTLEIVGTPQQDGIAVSLSSTRLRVAGSLGNTSISQTFAYSAVKRIMANFGDGNDTMTLFGIITTPLLIVGGGGNDTLTAAAGAAVMIGGAGQDRLTGGSKSDILIAGTTAYDTNPAALAAILTEWSSGRTLAARSDNLHKGTGSVLDGSGIRLTGQTVFDDQGVDTLMGGNDLDWFLYDTKRDKVQDKKSGELTN